MAFCRLWPQLEREMLLELWGYHVVVTINTLDGATCPKWSLVGNQSGEEPRSSCIYIPAKFNPVVSKGLRVLVNIPVSDQESGGQNLLRSKGSALVLLQPVNTECIQLQTLVILGGWWLSECNWNSFKGTKGRRNASRIHWTRLCMF